MAPIRVHITDAYDMFRCGLRALIELKADLCVVSEATNYQDTIVRVRESRPDVAILWINDPQCGATQLVQRLDAPPRGGRCHQGPVGGCRIALRYRRFGTPRNSPGSEPPWK